MSEVEKDGQGVIVSLPTQWKTPVNDGKLLAFGVYAPIVFNDYVVCPGVRTQANKVFGRIILHGINAETGAIKWTWDDYLTDFDQQDVTDHYQFRKYFFNNNGPRNYCIDLETGQSVWRKWLPYNAPGRGRATGLGMTAFVEAGISKEDGRSYENHIFKTNVYTGATEQIITANIPRDSVLTNGLIGGASTPAAFAVGGDTILAVPCYQATSGRANQWWLGAYSLQQRKWLYEKVPIAGPAVGQSVMKVLGYNGRVYITHANVIFCFEVSSGKLLWKQDVFRGDFLFSGIKVVDGVLVANCEDTYLYGVNPETGSILWKEKSSGTSSRLFDLNGVVYFAGGGDGKLHAVDVRTGKHVWRLDSPDLKENSGAYFFMVAGTPGKNGRKGRIVACTGRNVYGYEAAR